MKRIKLLILSGLMLLTVGAGALVPAVASADSSKTAVCDALGGGDDCTKNGGDGGDITKVVRQVVDLLSIVVGMVAVIMIIVAGFRFVSSGGDSNKVSGARNTILYAIVGLIVVALAQFIVHFVMASVTAPNCSAGTTLNRSTNKCVSTKSIKASFLGGSSAAYTFAETYRGLN